jgi:hypothetical protein
MLFACVLQSVDTQTVVLNFQEQRNTLLDNYDLPDIIGNQSRNKRNHVLLVVDALNWGVTRLWLMP